MFVFNLPILHLISNKIRVFGNILHPTTENRIGTDIPTVNIVIKYSRITLKKKLKLLKEIRQLVCFWYNNNHNMIFNFY